MKSHVELHLALDDLLARFLTAKRILLPALMTTPISELLQWSAAELDRPASTLPTRAVIALEEEDGKVRVLVEHGREVPPTSPVGDMLGFLMDRARGR